MNIEDRISVFKSLLGCVNEIPLTVLTPDTFEIVSSTEKHPDVMMEFFSLQFYSDHENNSEVPVEKINTISAPSVFTNSFGMAWISDVEIEDGNVKCIYMLGPVFLDDFSVYFIENELEHMTITLPQKRRFMEHIMHMPIIGLHQFNEYGVMLHYCLHGERVSISDFNYPIEEREAQRSNILKETHGSYMAEQELLKLVESGTMQYEEALNKLLSKGSDEGYGGNLYLRRQKDGMIAFATLCSRAAIRGGLDFETALSLCDSYYRSIEEAKNLSAISSVMKNMIRDFIYRVHLVKVKNGTVSPQIMKSCDYIHLHLEEEISIHSLASRLGYSDYYFSNKFKQETGLSVRDYIMRAKMEKAKDLLRNTPLSVSEISDQLGFASQSYFGEVFKKETGLTPVRYRSQKE